MQTELWLSFREWTIQVHKRVWNMVNILFTAIPLIAGIVAYFVWAMSFKDKPPILIWSLILIIGGSIFWGFCNFLAFHKVRVDRDNLKIKIYNFELELKSESPKLRPDLKIGAKLQNVHTAGYYDLADGGYPEGDKDISINLVFEPVKPVAVNILSLRIWGKDMDLNTFRTESPFDFIPVPMPLILKETKNYSFYVHIPKELAIDTEAYIYALTSDQKEIKSNPFPIKFGDPK